MQIYKKAVTNASASDGQIERIKQIRINGLDKPEP